MKLLRLALAGLMLLTVTSVALIARNQVTSAELMADAASKFLTGLSPELRKKATYEFNDAERLNWHFVPRQDNKTRQSTRNGVRVGEMTEAQKTAMLLLLRSGTSETGYTQVTTIMSLEAILKELEKNGAMVRDTGWYFVTIFGQPGKTGSWGWRIEGHHLSINFRIDNGVVTSTTPLFFGANPAEIKFGPRKGERVLGVVEETAIKLYESLDEQQQQVAFQVKEFADVEEIPAANVGTPVGLPAKEFRENQRGLLVKLIEAYANRMPDDLAATAMKEVKESGIDKVHFAYTGSTEPGKPHTYRVQGPTFVIEFLNVQKDASGNVANHIHSVWRTLPKDFGLSE